MTHLDKILNIPETAPEFNDSLLVENFFNRRGRGEDSAKEKWDHHSKN